MKDLSWTKVPPGTPDEGPDTKGFFDVAHYGTSIDHGHYTQWTNVEFYLDTKHDPPLFWRHVHAGTDFSRWAVALVPDWPKKPKVEEKKE